MLEELKQRVLEANLLLPKHGLITFTWGNVSGIDREMDIVAIKPSGVEYDHMTVQDIVLCDLDGNVVEGKLKPSSDLMTHLAFYKSFPNVGGAVHNAVVMEECAAMAFVSIMLQDNTVQPMQQVLLDKHFKRKHGPNAYYGQ